jgi:membrane-bound metal-dependent hydrolase YbcI (DUF457 family)
LGYLVAKLTAQATETRMNIPLVLTLSVIPDIDILLPFVEHRGPFHSIVMATVIFVPILVLYGKGGFPYYAALVQHSLLGDYISGGRVQLLWPLTRGFFGIEISIASPTSITLEWLTFLTAVVIMLKTKDMQTLFQPHNSNLVLAIPTFTVLLPTFFAYPLEVPVALVPPHLVFLIVFLASMLMDMRKILSSSPK